MALCFRILYLCMVYGHNNPMLNGTQVGIILEKTFFFMDFILYNNFMNYLLTETKYSWKYSYRWIKKMFQNSLNCNSYIKCIFRIVCIICYSLWLRIRNVVCLQFCKCLYRQKTQYPTYTINIRKMYPIIICAIKQLPHCLKFSQN